MPELPEVQAHAERLTELFAGAVLQRFVPLNFTALKTAVPPPSEAYGHPLHRRRAARQVPAGSLRAGDVRRPPDAGRAAAGGRQAVGQAAQRAGPLRVPGHPAGAAAHRGRHGAARRRVVRRHARPTARCPRVRRSIGSARRRSTSPPTSWPVRFAAHNMRVHGFLRDQHMIAGLGRMLANEVCHRAKISPFAMTGKLGAEGAAKVVTAIHEAVDEGLAYERTRSDMSSSADRPGPRPQPRRRTVPGVRRHDPQRQLQRLHRGLLPHLPDRRQGARRQHDVPVPQVAASGVESFRDDGLRGRTMRRCPCTSAPNRPTTHRRCSSPATRDGRRTSPRRSSTPVPAASTPSVARSATPARSRARRSACRASAWAGRARRSTTAS